jgi:phage tail-like protein
MSTPRDFKVYRFADSAHWKTGILSKLRIQAQGTVIPERPLAPSPLSFLKIPGGAELLAFDAYGTAYWHTCDEKLQWLEEGNTRIYEIEANFGIARSPRLAIGRQWLWAFKPESSCLFRYDLETLQQDSLICESRSISCIQDIASDGHDGIWLLSASDSASPALYRIDACNHISCSIILAADSGCPRGIAYLAKSKCVIVLSADGKSITLIDEDQPKEMVTVWLQHEVPGFSAFYIDSDRHSRILLVGATGQNDNPIILLIDSSGSLLDKITTGLQGHKSIRAATAWGKTVLVATENGLLRFRSEPASNSVGADGVFLSPTLYSPDTDSLRGWLRAEFTAVLPKGSTLTVTVLGTDDPAVMEDVKALSQLTTLPPSRRQSRIRQKLKRGSDREFVFVSPHEEALPPPFFSSGSMSFQPKTYTVPLFDRKERWLWLEMRITAASDTPDDHFPEVHQLCVIYPDISLSQYVPAIFRGDVTARDLKSGDPSGFFRQLLGVLETTTQGIDQTIAKLGGNINPATAQGDWLDFLARWMDLPWDDALPEEIKQRLLCNAAKLLAKRGSKAGLELLLLLLFSSQEKFRVTDVNVDIGVAILGSQVCPGSALPTVLSGLPGDAAVLSRKTVLGFARLANDNSDTVGVAAFKGWLRIEINASNEERTALEAIVPKLISEMIPAGIRFSIRWRPAVLGFNRKLNLGFILDNPSPRRLSQDAQLGLMVLAGKRQARLKETGFSLGFRLK